VGLGLFAVALMLGVGVACFCLGWIYHEERDRRR
jgi:hypothetical protein